MFISPETIVLDLDRAQETLEKRWMQLVAGMSIRAHRESVALAEVD